MDVKENGSRMALRALSMVTFLNSEQQWNLHASAPSLLHKEC